MEMMKEYMGQGKEKLVQVRSRHHIGKTPKSSYLKYDKNIS